MGGAVNVANVAVAEAASDLPRPSPVRARLTLNAFSDGRPEERLDQVEEHPLLVPGRAGELLAGGPPHARDPR